MCVLKLVCKVFVTQNIYVLGKISLLAFLSSAVTIFAFFSIGPYSFFAVDMFELYFHECFSFSCVHLTTTTARRKVQVCSAGSIESGFKTPSSRRWKPSFATAQHEWVLSRSNIGRQSVAKQRTVAVQVQISTSTLYQPS